VTNLNLISDLLKKSDDNEINYHRVEFTESKNECDKCNLTKTGRESC